MTATRVLFPFVGDTVGGSHRSAILLIKALDPECYEPVVLLHRDGPLRPALEKAGVAYLFVNSLPILEPVRQGNLGATTVLLRCLPRLSRFLRSEGIGIVHCHDARMLLTWALPARISGCKLVLHQRTRHVHSRITKAAARLSHRLICISRYVAGTLPDDLRSYSVVIPNPFRSDRPIIDRTSSRSRLCNELHLPKDIHIVVFAGTMQEQKRPDIFVDAASRMVASIALPLAFVMIGRTGGSWERRIKELAVDRGLEGRLFLLGYRTDVMEILAAADIVLAPAVEEGFGRVLVEAAICGTPVVAARSGGHEEAIIDGQTGILVQPDDPAALADAALSLLHDPERGSRMVAAARRRAEEKFSPERHAAQVMRVYDSVLANRKPERPDHVAFVIEGLGGGGSQHVLTTLANAWVEKGRRVSVITFSAEVSEGLSLDPRIRHVVIGGIGESANRFAGIVANLGRILRLREALRQSGSPIVIPFISTTNILTLLAAAGLGRRIVVCERNDPKRQNLCKPWGWLRRKLYPKATVVTANSQPALDALAEFVPRERLRLLPNPLRKLEAGEICPVPRPFILSVGRLHPQKAHDVLLSAFAAAQDALQGWRLVILGEGVERQTLEQQAQSLGIAELVEMPGHVETPLPWYQAADMFVLASRYEGTSNALLEAMSCGVPPIVTDGQSGSLEVVRDGISGLVVPVDSVPDLANALRLLANDEPQRRRLGLAARDSVERYMPAAAFAVWERAVFGEEGMKTE